MTSRSRLLGRVLKQVLPVFVFALVGCGKVKTSITSLKNTLNPVTAKKIKVNLDQISLTFVEGSVAVINVQLNEKREQDTTVDLSLTGAADVGTRFSAISPASSITIPAGSISRSIVLSSVDDSVYEGSESYVLHVETADSGVEVVTPTMPITLTDNEAVPAVSFSLASQTVLEGVGTGTATVQLDHASLFAISVPYTVSDGTAVAGSDYTMSSGTLNFAAGETSKTLSFSIIDDSAVETTENFSVALGTVTGVATLGTHSTHTVSIIDNDSASLFVGSVTVNETAGTATIPITLSMASTGTVTANWATVADTATAGTHYTTSSGSISIPAGQTSTNVTVPILHAVGVCEADKTFHIHLTSAVNASISANDVQSTIQDVDVPTVSVANASANEGSALVVVATLSQACSTKSVSLTWSNSAGTAVAGTHYTSVSGQVVSITAGNTTANLSTPTLDDGKYDTSKTINVTVSAATNATIASASAVGTINNITAVPTLAVNDITVSEGAGTATFTVTQSAVSAMATTFHWSTVDGTALAGSDYTAVGDTVATIAAGATTASLTVTISDDHISESTESFAVALVTPTNATISDASGTAQITDNDLPAFSITGATGGTDAAADHYLSSVLTPTINWNAATGASDYSVQIFSDASGTVSVCGPETTSSTSLAVSSCTLTAGQTYYASVVANPGATLAANNLYSFYTNRSPSVTNDGPYYVLSGGNITISVLGNDSDADGDTLTVASVSTASKGTTSNTSSSVTYTNSGSTGVDTFTYTASDGNGGLTTGTVTVHVVTAFTWTGSVSSTWDATAANWCGAINAGKTGCTNGGSAPTSTSDVIIDDTCTGANCNPTTGINVSVKSISLTSKTLTQGSGRTITLNATGTGFKQYSGVFVGANANITGPSLTVTSGTYTATSATTQLTAGISVAAGAVFIHNNGLFEFKTSVNSTYDFNSHHFYDMSNTATSGYSLTVSSPIYVDHNFTSSSTGTHNYSSATIYIAGDLTMTGGVSSLGTSVFRLNGTGAQTVTSTTGSTIPNLYFDGANVILGSRVEVSGDLKYVSGSVTTTGSTVVMTEAKTQNIDIGSLVLDSAILGASGFSKTITNSLYISGLLDLRGQFTVGNSIFASGDVTIASASGATAKVTLSGSSQTVTGGGTAPFFQSLIIASTGTVNLAGTIGVNGDLTWTSGTINAGTSKIRTQSVSGTLNLGSQVLYDLDLAHAGATKTVTGTLYVAHNLTISGGTTSGGTLDVKGDVTATAGAVTSALVVSGSGAQSISSTAGFPTGTITINKSAGVATLATNLSLSTSGQDLLLQSGSLDLNGKTLTVNDLFTLSAGTTMYTSCGSYSPSSGVKFSNSGTIVGGSNVYLSIDDVTVTEGSAATLTVSLSGVNCAAVNFNYATVDGTAVGGSDYTSKSGSGSIAAGATSTTISVNTTADGVYEGGTENFSLGLSSVTGSSVSDNTGVVTINDADSAPTVQFSASTQTVLENAGTATITVSQSGASAFTTTVPYTVSGTAVATTDYTLSPANSVTIAAGATSATVTATIVDNSVAAADKTVILTMGTVTNATASGRTAHTLTIQNDDLGAFAISGIAGATDSTDDAYLSMDLLPKVTWASSSGATSYNVTVYQDDGTTVQCATHNTASTSYQFTSGDCGGNLTVGTYYKAKVESTDGTLTQLASNSLYRFKVNSAPTFSSQGPFYVLSSSGGSITINAAAASSPGVGADADGDTVTFSATANGALGTVVNGSTSFTYSPASSSTFGTDTVAVTLSDGHGGTVSGNITIKLVSNVSWTGGGANSNWSTAANWCGAINASKTGCTNGGSAPSSAAVAIFDNTCVSNCSATLSADTTVGGIKLSSGTITQGGYNLTVNSNGGFTQTGGSFVGGTGSITQNGAVSLTGGTFKSTSGTMATIGQWTVTSGVTFDNNNGTIQFSSSYFTPVALAVDNEIYKHVTFLGNTTNFTLTGSMNIQGTTTLTSIDTSYSCNINNGTLLASGDVIVTQQGCAGSGLLKIVGSANQAITDSTGYNLPSLQIASTGGTVSFSGTLNVIGDYTYTSGTVDVGTSTLKIAPGYAKTATVTPGNITYNNFTVYSYDSTFNFSGSTLKVGGTLGLTTYSGSGCTLNNGTLAAYGDVLNSGGGCGPGTALVKVMGSGNQTVTGASASYFPNFEVASTGGTVTYAGTLQFYGNYTHTSGTVNSGTSSVNFFGPYSASRTIVPGSTTFNDVTFSGSGANLSLSNGTVTVAGTLTLTSQVGNGINLNSGTVLASGNVDVTGSGVSGSALIRLVGSSNQTLTGVSSANLPDVEIASTGGTVSLSGTIDVRGNYTFTSGSLAAGTSTLRFMGNYAASRNISVGSATYANVVFSSYDSTYNLGGGTLNASTLTFTTVSGSGCTINSGTLAVTGDVSVTVNGCAGTAGVNFTGSSDSNFTSSGGNFPRGNTTVTKGAANTVTLGSNLSLSGTGQTLVISSGTLNMSGKNLSVNSNLTISAGATLTQGGGTLTYGSLTNNGTLN